jgi:hypothetical protein
MSYEKEFFLITFARNLKKLPEKELRQICRDSLTLFFNKSTVVENFTKSRKLDFTQTLTEKIEHNKALDDLETKQFEELFNIALNTMKAILMMDTVFVNEVSNFK